MFCSRPIQTSTSRFLSSSFINIPKRRLVDLLLHVDTAVTTLIIHHPILPLKTQNFSISQILPSIDIWHLFGLISRIPRLLYVFFSVSVCSSFQLSLFPSVLLFLSQVSHPSHNRLFLDFYLFFTFLVPFKIFLVF